MPLLKTFELTAFLSVTNFGGLNGEGKEDDHTGVTLGICVVLTVSVSPPLLPPFGSSTNILARLWRFLDEL